MEVNKNLDGNILRFSFGSLDFYVSLEKNNNNRFDVVFGIDVSEDKIFFHRKNGKSYKPFIGTYRVKNPENFYVSLRALLNRDYSYSHNEFNNKDGKGSKVFRMLYSRPSVKSAYGVLVDYVSSLNGSSGDFIDNIKELISLSNSSYDVFSRNYKKFITVANYRQFSKFVLDAYKVLNGYETDKFSLKEIVSAFYPYQQLIFEFMHNAEEPRYTLVYLDYFILDTIKEQLERFLETFSDRNSLVYGVSENGKNPPILVIEKSEGKRELSLFPFGVKTVLNETDYLLLKKALGYYINTGIAPRFISKEVGIMGGNNSVVLFIKNKFFNIVSREMASRILFKIL